MEEHLEKECQVDLISCDGELAICDNNVGHQRWRCAACVLRREVGIGALRAPINKFGIRDFDGEPIDTDAMLEGIESIEQLKALRFHEFDLGYAVASSVITMTRNAKPEFEAHRPMVRKYVQSSARIYDAFLRYLNRQRPDRVYIFNGRFAHNRAVVRACQAHGTAFTTHELGWRPNQYSLFHDRLVHDINKTVEEVNLFWEEAGDARETIGAKWYQDRRSGDTNSHLNFIEKMNNGLIPEGLSEDKRLITAFTSSDDEFVSITPDWEEGLMPDQGKAIPQILKMLDPEQDILAVRIHPNTSDSSWKRLQEALKDLPGMILIAPDAQFDSYTLLEASKMVISFGSTIGIEACFHGKPVILLKNCVYANLDVAYVPADQTALAGLLSNRSLPAKDREGALKYGYYFKSRGDDFRFFKSRNFIFGKFKGRNLLGHNLFHLFRPSVRRAWWRAIRAG